MRLEFNPHISVDSPGIREKKFPIASFNIFLLECEQNVNLYYYERLPWQNILSFFFFRVLVMGEGEVLEFDSPKALLQNKASHFYKLVHQEMYS